MHILLVHGAFHDERCWKTFLPYIEANGFAAHTLTLRGHGDNKMSAFRASMASYARDVCARAAQIGAPCALLGHSMGGLVVTAAAEARPDLFSHVIYLAAFAPPRAKTTMLALQGLAKNTPMNKAVEPCFMKGYALLDQAAAKDLLYNTCDSEVATHALTQLCPQPLRPSFSRIGWSDNRLGKIPRFYIECTEDRAIPIASQRAMQNYMPFKKISSLTSDHSPFLSMPQQLAGTIAELLQPKLQKAS